MHSVIENPDEQTTRATRFIIRAMYSRATTPGAIASPDEARKVFNLLCARMPFRDMFFLDLDTREKLAELLYILGKMLRTHSRDCEDSQSVSREDWSSILTDQEGAQLIAKVLDRAKNDCNLREVDHHTARETIARVSIRIDQLMNDPRVLYDGREHDRAEYDACIDEIMSELTMNSMKGFSFEIRYKLALILAQGGYIHHIGDIISRDEWINYCTDLFAARDFGTIAIH